MRELKVGMKVGQRVVRQVTKSKRFAYCTLQCVCGNVRKAVPISSVVYGRALECKACWQKRRQAAVDAALAILGAVKHAEAARVREYFQVLDTAKKDG